MAPVVTTRSWGSRIINALWGILIGLALIIGSFVLIFWNEGHGLHMAQSLDQTRKVLISVPNSPLNSQNNLKVIYFYGMANTNDILTDPLLKISEKAIKLNRHVEMYQWKENSSTKTEKKLGGSEEDVTTYTYSEVWSDQIIDSSKFNEAATHQNPNTMPVTSRDEQAKNVNVGDFVLPTDLIEQIDGATSVDLSKVDAVSLKEKLKKPIHLEENVLYIGESSSTPKIGDLKISASVVLPQTVSIIAQQSGNTLQAYQAPAGEAIMLLAMGQVASGQMITDAESSNQMTTWLLRLLSLILLIIGITLLLQPLVVLADVVPFVGSIVSMGTGLIAFVGGLMLWAIATGISWFTVRPVWALGLIIIVSLISYCVFKLKKKKPQIASP